MARLVKATGTLMTAANLCYGEEKKRGFASFDIHALWR